MSDVQKRPGTITVMQCRSTYATGGGPDKTVLLIAEKADPERFNVVVLYMRGAHDEAFQIGNWARAKGLTFHEVLEHTKLDLKNLREIHTLIQRYQVDILHARDYKTAVVGYLLSFFHPRMKLIFTSHLWQDLDSLKMKFYTWLNIKALTRYHKIIAVSDDLKRYMIGRGIDERKIVTVHNAIDVDAWSRQRVTSTLREELALPPDAKLIGVVGRLRYEKDLPTTLQVAERVIRERPDAYFLIVGDGPDKDALEQQAREMGLEDHVLFLGFRKDADNIYAGLDIFASTARTEGTPNTVLEAMAMDVPVVYTAVGGVPELVEDGKTGLLCRVGDVEGISGAILSLLNDPEKAIEFGKRGRERVCDHFSLTNRLQKLEAIYEDVAGAA